MLYIPYRLPVLSNIRLVEMYGDEWEALQDVCRDRVYVNFMSRLVVRRAFRKLEVWYLVEEVGVDASGGRTYQVTERGAAMWLAHVDEVKEDLFWSSVFAAQSDS